MGKIVTFYSYGGAGRTMALANVAVRIAKLGLRVVAVDWDLEGPGLHRFLPTEKAHDAPDARGLLEYFDAWREALELGAPEPPSVLGSLTPTVVAPVGSILRVLLAGRLDLTYGARLDELDLETFYARDCGGAAVETLRQQLASACDVVLVDSRSGLTDLGGVCAIQIPDGVVFLSLPNERSYEGVSGVAAAIAKSSRESRAERGLPTTWFVMSRAPILRYMLDPWLEANSASFERDMKDGLWTAGEHPKGLSTYRLPDVPRWAFGEPIVPSDPDDPLAEGYDKLAGALHAWATAPASNPSPEGMKT